MAELPRKSSVRGYLPAIANLKKTVLLQVVVVWKPCAECPGDGCTWKVLLEKLLTHSLTSKAYKRREGMQLGKHQNSIVGGRMCMNALECRQKCS